jgi:uncharacterized damage-inducible protein DinB
MTLERLFHYSEWCQARLEETLSQNDALLHRGFETTSKFDTIAKLLAHSLAAEERWLVMRLGHAPISRMYEDRAPETLKELFADARAIRENTRQFVARQTPESLAAVSEIELGSVTLKLSVEDVLYHVLHHESWHRAQISMALQQFGVDPPNFDFCFIGRTVGASPSV